MKKLELEKIAKNLIETFIISGDRAIELRNQGLITQIKPDNTPVTNGDLEVDKLIKKKFCQSHQIFLLFQKKQLT